MFYRRILKNVIDRVVAAAGITVLSPVMAALALAILVRQGRPIIFRQVRPGFHEKPFVFFKFRTMRDARDSNGRPLEDGLRLTALGRLLRASSLDELPQLWNVLTGDMSLVGPRPLLPQYLPRYTPHQKRRHEAKPGITGWAQIHGRNGLTWEQKFDLDVWYVDNFSFWLDVKIIAKTCLKVIKREDINSAGHATMPEFMGTVSNPNQHE